MARKKNTAVNEFNQVIEGTSLTKEAWKRLKKNKMAVFGMVVVIIYAFIAIIAGLLPLYPYDEIVTEHQHLRPSLTMTSGELMLEKKYKDVFTSVWKSGRMPLSSEEDERVRYWVMNDDTNKAWDLLYERGMESLVNGTLTLSASEQKSIDRVINKIDTDVMITVYKIYGDINGKKTNLKKATAEELLTVYAAMINADKDKIQSTVRNELLSSIKNTIKNNDSEGVLTQDEINSQAAEELDGYSEKDYSNLVKENLYSKISAQVNKDALKHIKEEIKNNPELSFPVKEEISMANGLTADIKASRTHD